MLYTIRVILIGIALLAGVATLIGLVATTMPGCAAPPKTALDAEKCRRVADRDHLPGLVAEARHNCPQGGRAEYCVSARTIESYQAALDACRESR